MWNPFVDRVDADAETLNGRSNRHQQLLDDNLKWQRKAEELAGRHEQRIAHLEGVLEETLGARMHLSRVYMVITL